MRAVITGMAFVGMVSSSVVGQRVTVGPTFDVASVKPAASQGSNIMRFSGGPGTADPERFSYANVTLKALMLRAYGLKRYQISGPGWLDSERFDIRANVPPGASKEQLNGMLRNLLVDRFNLTFHHETKDLAVYDLVVGKNGPKLRESDLKIQRPVPEPGSPPPLIGVPDQAGFPQIPPGLPYLMGRMTDGIMRWASRLQPLSELVLVLENELDRPVVDKTGLTGKYDINLAYSRDGLRPLGPAPATTINPVDPSGGLSLLGAVQEQLGLKLESAKDPLDILVVDHIDKMPTEN